MPKTPRRESVLQLVRIAGYHNDSKRATRLFIENRIGLQVYTAAFRAGRAAKAAGLSCSCEECSLEGQHE